MKIFATLLLLCCCISALAYMLWIKPNKHTVVRPAPAHSWKDRAADNSETLTRLYHKAIAAEHYCKAYGYNTQYCFLLDMRVASGKNRFFIYDMKNDSVEAAGLVTHGGGSDDGYGKLSFSNTPNSHCTSLGKYKIGISYNGKFGLAYKLHGLDQTNSKAFQRFVVLHAHACVPDTELRSGSLCVSQGCPTVSPVFLLKLKTYLDRSEKPILLWIYH